MYDAGSNFYRVAAIFGSASNLAGLSVDALVATPLYESDRALSFCLDILQRVLLSVQKQVLVLVLVGLVLLADSTTLADVAFDHRDCANKLAFADNPPIFATELVKRWMYTWPKITGVGYSTISKKLPCGSHTLYLVVKSRSMTSLLKYLARNEDVSLSIR